MRCPTLADLPPPPAGKTGWPWTAETPQLPPNRPDGSPWPRISIVTPSYNQSQFIEETLRSVLLQGYPDLEYIVIDGGSTDGAVDIIRKYAPWLTYWVNEPDRSQMHALNKGLSRATGQLLNWLNSDDSLLQNALLTVAEIDMALPTAGIISGSRLQVDKHGRLLVAQTNWLHAWPMYAIGLPDFPQEASFFSRHVWESVGALDEELAYMFDVAFYARALPATDRIALTKAPLSTMHVYRETKTLRDDPERKAKEMRAVVSRHIAPTLVNRLIPRLMRTRFHHFVLGTMHQLLCAQKKIWVVDYSPIEERWIALRP